MTVLAPTWWTLALRGVAAILFGILTLLLPGVALAALLYVFGAYALVDGAFNVIAGLRGREAGRRWWSLLLEGLVSIAAGVLTFALPGLTALALLYTIAVWAVIRGALQITAAIRLREQITGEWLLGASGALSIVFGAVLFLAPAAGALVVVLWVGAYALVFGALLVALGFRLRHISRRGGIAEPTERRAA